MLGTEERSWNYRVQKLFYNGDIITMEAEEQAPEAILIQDGIIRAVGGRKELEALCGEGTEYADLRGNTLMPSFIDGHGHITIMVQMSRAAELSDCESFNDIVRVMKAYIAEKGIPAGQPVMGFGYDHNLLEEERHPTKETLDRISDSHPVYVCHTSAHMGCVNSIMLQRAGITAGTPDVEGGSIGRGPDGREPDGYLEEGAVRLLQDVLSGPALAPADSMQALDEAQMKYLKNGITTVQDGATTPPMLKLLAEAAAQGRLKVDVVSYPLMTDGARELREEYAACDNRYVNRLKLGGYKLVLDGSPQGKSAWLTRPYEGEDSYRGYAWMPDDTVLTYIRQAIEDNRQLLAHCNGDAAADQYLACYGQALEESENPCKHELRPVMIHCQTVRDDQLDRMAELSMIPSIFVAHVYYWGDVHRKNLGKERGSHISPARAALDRGLCVNFHQDAPVVRPLMLHTVWTAVNRVSRKGNVIGPDQKISVYEALKAVTANAAYMYGEEERKGTLREGKLADMVILSRNPLKVNPMEIQDIEVLETIKEGKTLYVK